MRVQCHNVVNGFCAANSISRRYPANPTGAGGNPQTQNFLGFVASNPSHLSKTAKGGASPRWAARRRST